MNLHPLLILAYKQIYFVNERNETRFIRDWSRNLLCRSPSRQLSCQNSLVLFCFIKNLLFIRNYHIFMNFLKLQINLLRLHFPKLKIKKLVIFFIHIFSFILKLIKEAQLFSFFMIVCFLKKFLQFKMNLFFLFF